MADPSTIPLVLLPGLQSDHRSWSYQLAYFQDDFEVMVPTGYQYLETIEAMAAHVERQLPDRFHLIAWSMGGYITFQMLPHIQQRLVSLVLMATSARPEDEASTRRRNDLIEIARKKGMPHAATSSINYSHLNPHRLNPAIRDALIQSSVDLGFEAYRLQQQAIITRPDAASRMTAINCPTLVLVGDGDRVTPPDRAREIHRAIPHSRFEIIEDCGHCPPLEKPDLINRTLEQWIREHALALGSGDKTA